MSIDLFSENRQTKSVIMLIIDTLMNTPLQQAMKSGDAPALKFFMDHGNYFSNVVSPLPTMSVNVDSTLLTGVYCDEHRVPGLVWFDEKERRIVNYGSTYRELMKLGIKKSLHDLFYKLNHVHLNQEYKTIHEELAEQGKSSASINALLYRGKNNQQLEKPMLTKLFPFINREWNVQTPDLFTYGAFKKLQSSYRYCYFWRKYGFNDKFSKEELITLIKKGETPSFSIVYFPELDKRVHKRGRYDIKGIKQVDQQLQQLLNTYSSWEDALKDHTWIILGDNGQAPILPDKNKALINLSDIFSSYHIVKLKQGVSPNDQIVLGVNERMAFIYSLDLETVPLTEIIHLLQEDERIDVIAWKDDGFVKVRSGDKSGELHFQPNGKMIDEYNQSWTIEGEYNILDLSVKDQYITYGDYPDALARLYSSCYSHEGHFVVVSAKPGYEFVGESSPTHVGGASHGGLHKQDSLVPMIVTGTDTKPEYLRMKDLKNWMLTLI